MKRIKLLGLLAVTALAAMAIAGAGSASATSFCKVNVEYAGPAECPTASKYALPLTLNAHSTDFKVDWGGATRTCPSSDLELKMTTNKGEGAGLSGQLSGLTFSGCEGNWPCELGPTAKHLPYAAELQQTSGGNGTLTLSSGGSGKPALEFSYCGLYRAACTFEASKVSLDFNGGNPASLQLKSTKLESNSSYYCQSLPTPTISATYTVLLPIKFPFEASATSTFSGSGIENITCESSIQANSSGSITALSFSKCGSTCTSATATSLPYGTSTSPGHLFVENGGTGNPGVQFAGCFYFFSCKFEATKGIELDYSGGNLIANKEPLNRVSGTELCPTPMSWSATYPIGGGGVWLSKGP